MKFYMFRTVPLSIIRSFSLYTQQWYVIQVCWQLSSRIRILLASCVHICMTYTIAVCTVKNSWWWTEELSETCRVSFQEWIWEISASCWFYYRNSALSVSPCDNSETIRKYFGSSVWRLFALTNFNLWTGACDFSALPLCWRFIPTENLTRANL